MCAKSQKTHLNESLIPKLFVNNEDEYGEDYRKHLFEQYKLYVEMTDRICARRSKSNNYFLSINTLLLTATSILSRLGSGFSAFYPWWIVFTSPAGILFCVAWLNIIRSYLQLSTGKFQVILEIEKRLPIAMFETEWTYLKSSDSKSRYVELTRSEKWVPMIFAAMYAALALIAIFSPISADS